MPTLDQQLFDAAEAGDTTRVQELVAQGADLNARNEEGAQTPLMRAVWNGHPDLFRYLMDQGVDVDVRCRRGTTALWYALMRERSEIVAALQEEVDAAIHPDWDEEGTRLVRAASHGRWEEVVDLLDADVDVDQTDSHQTTALMHACWSGHGEIVRMLIERGADVNRTNERGGTPLKYAIARNHPALVALLIELGANVNPVPDFKGKTPLDYAREGEHRELVDVLITAGAR